ncbi:MAG: nitroreductase family protein [Candidatus Binatia bacterium]|nr:nitroreductase family protein [Candidatus Binatia bacterium]
MENPLGSRNSHGLVQPRSKVPAGISRRTFLAIGGTTAASLLTGQATGTESPPCTMDVFEAIYSLRAIRRLKPDPIPVATLRKIVEAGTHAPNGGNLQAWGFIVVREAERKRFIRDRYWAAWQKLQAGRPSPSELPPERRRALRASAYLAEHLHEVPVILLACALKEYPPWVQTGHTRAAVATMHGSIYPAVQNILLACRALGVGATLTTLHYFFEEELKQKFRVPENMEIAALLPLGLPRGKFGRNRRKPVEEVLFWEEWGSTTA